MKTKTLKQLATELKSVLDIHDKAYRDGHELIWRACNEQIEAISDEACIVYIKLNGRGGLFPKNNQSLLEYLNPDNTNKTYESPKE